MTRTDTTSYYDTDAIGMMADDDIIDNAEAGFLQGYLEAWS